eukprot:s5268_g1.t1
MSCAAIIRITVVSRSCGDDPVSNPQNLKKQQHRCLQAFVGLALYLVDWASLLGTVQRYLATLGVQRLDRARVWREEEPNDRRRWR